MVDVTRYQVIRFLEEAACNWKDCPSLDYSDVDDVAQALERFANHHVEAALLKGAQIGLEAAVAELQFQNGSPTKDYDPGFNDAHEIRALDPAQVLAAHRAGGGG